jgi:hypothetical protein
MIGVRSDIRPFIFREFLLQWLMNAVDIALLDRPHYEEH